MARGMSYDEIYGFRKKKSSRRPLGPVLPLGFSVARTGFWRARTRTLMLAGMFVSMVVYVLYRAQPGSGQGEDAYQAVLPRKLHDGMQHGYDCLDADAYYDMKKVRLTMVRKYHVTMGGEHGDSCASSEGPCLKKKNEWALILYLPAMFYMFIALAIVCDEFFVPSLEAFVDHYEISLDVAGATFMAAGGSMPELFTSFIATFDRTDVGFSAIIGSAVFNVLFVIAVCALASAEPLALTWWPLARDCTFYIIGLLLVAFFFSITSKTEITFVEALILFLWYFVYCAFMRFNSRANEWVQGHIDKLKSKKTVAKVAPEEEVEPIHPAQESGKESVVNMKRPSQFRAGICSLLVQHTSITETVGISVVTEFKGNIKEAFDNAAAENEDGCLRETSFKRLLEDIGWNMESPRKKDAANSVWLQLSRGKCLDWDTFWKWYMVSQARVEVEARRVFDKFDKNKDGTIDVDEVEAVFHALGHKPSQDELVDIMREMIASNDEACEGTDDKQSNAKAKDEGKSGQDASRTDDKQGKSDSVTFDQFERWYISSLLAQKHSKKHQLEEIEEDQGFKIDWPEEAKWYQLLWYFFTYPLCAAMYCSLPDIRRENMHGKVEWAIIQFLLSLVWIMIFSNCLYECCIVCSNTVGLQPPIAAVTIVAAGTSIPDLLSSYIVAVQGEGDMAVSSSIGSNLFDITVGLPVPWMTFMVVEAIKNGKMENVAVQTKSIGFSILVLILMLTAVILTVVASSWKMSKTLGGVMFLLYFVFIALYLLQNFPNEEEAAWKITW